MCAYMGMYVYVYIYIHIHIHIHTYMSIYKYMYRRNDFQLHHFASSAVKRILIDGPLLKAFFWDIIWRSLIEGDYEAKRFNFMLIYSPSHYYTFF